MSTVLASIILSAGITALSACAQQSPETKAIGNAELGRVALEQLECGVCHVIPGVSGAVGKVGPPLGSYRRRAYVAGKFPNTPTVLAQWIHDPPALAPRTAMPAVGATEAQARDMAAYLYTLE